MPVSTPRGERTQETILAAATQVVLESGPAAFSLREVARRSHLAPSALYNHFPNREALIIAIAQKALTELSAYLGVAGNGGTAADRLRLLGRAYFAFAADRPNEYRLVFECLENPAMSWESYLAIAEPFTLIVDACTSGLADGEFVDRAGVGAGGMAYGLWCLCHGHVSLKSRNLAYVQGDFDTLAAAAIEAVLAGWSTSSEKEGA